MKGPRHHFKVGRRVLGDTWDDPANRDKRASRVAVALRFQFQARFRHTPARVSYGRRSHIWAIHDGFSSSRAAYSPLPDFLEMTVWQRTLSPGSLFVDVGANVGLYTLIAIEAGAEVIAVEPQREAVDQLRRNLSLNDYDAAIVVACLAEKSGRRALAGADPNRQALVLDSTGSVNVMTLDDLIGSRIVEGIKIDVEGAERLVLEGAAVALREQRLRLIQLEWNQASLATYGEPREPTAALLRGYGYEICRPDEHGRLSPIDAFDFGADVFARPIQPN